jgi:hypothetical protein
MPRHAIVAPSADALACRQNPESSPGRGCLKKSPTVLDGLDAGLTNSDPKPDELCWDFDLFEELGGGQVPYGDDVVAGFFFRPNVVAVRVNTRFVSAFILAKEAPTRSSIEGPFVVGTAAVAVGLAVVFD